MASSGSDEEEFIPFKNRPEWEGVEPLKQYDGPNQIARIKYHPIFEETMDYLRAVIHKEEVSQRAFDLSEEVIYINPGCYTAWYLRRKCLEELKLDLEKEMIFLNKIGRYNPKNYQIWHHRKVVVEKYGKSTYEKAFVDLMLKDDEKNYHAWSYRIWVVNHFKLFEGELEVANNFLRLDSRSNSAWNYRHFLIMHTKERSKETVADEIEFAKEYIKALPDNESPWVYLSGWFSERGEIGQNKHMYREIPITEFPELKDFCQTIANDHQCRHAYGLLMKIYLEENTKDSLGFAEGICDHLANSVDRVRANYWNWRHQGIQELQKAL